MYGQIRQEALAPNSENNHPLPLLGSWNASTWWNYNSSAAGYSPSWQLNMIDLGHHFLPWFEIPGPDMKCTPNQFCSFTDYLKSPIQKAAALNLPISFVGTQWEQDLYDNPTYLNLPPDQNPNVVSLNGTVQQEISPFGPVTYWYQVGKTWGSSPVMQQVIAWYPNPPLVIFVSNNEASKLTWTEVETDKHYIDLYGYGHDDNFKRQVVADGWKDRYRALIQGFRDGLGNSNWQANSTFVGYEAFGPGVFGRWDGWLDYSLYIPGRIDPNPLYWEGGSASFYIWPTYDERDDNVMGPLFQAMNWVFMLNEAHQLNPSFWYELSTWDQDQDGRNQYAQLGQSFTPERYGGYVQFGMWLVRPRIVREYRAWDASRDSILKWFTPIISAVDQVYTNPTLQSFWRNSTLVENTARHHPYQSSIPPEYSTVPRMFLLTTNLDPAQPWSFNTEFSVMSLARVKGTSPHRQWLLYAYAPRGSEMSVQITIPAYKTVTVDVALGGSFYLIDESTNTIIPVT